MPKQKAPPAITDDARRNQLINMAFDLLEERLRDGTATSQEVTTLIKMSTERARLELEILRANKELALAKTEQIKSIANSDEIAQLAIEAMRRYDGSAIDDADIPADYPNP